MTAWDAFGNPLQVENIDGVATVSAADHMGRPFISYSETGSWSKSIHRVGAGSYCPGGTAFYTLTTAGGAPDQYQCYDVVGRESRAVAEGFDGRKIYIDRYYDSSGRVERVSEPYFSNESRYWNISSYDAIGRILMVDAANGNDLLNAWDNNATSTCATAGPRTVRITNGLGQERIERRNALGETTDTYDELCGHVSYVYDATGNLIEVTGADGAMISTTYDIAGRKVAMDDPDKGYWQYAYNALGELIRQLDSKNQAIDFDYDLLGRVTSRRELSGVSSLGDTSFTTVHSETTSWRSVSPGKAQIGTATYREGTSGTIVHQRDFTYDAFGRADVVSTSQDGLQLAEQTTYDEYGRVFQQFDASGDDRGIRYHYNTRGYLSKLREAREGTQGVTYQQIQAMDARGNVTYMLLGNGVEAYATYQPASGRLETLEAYDAQGVELQRVDYVFDVAGNLLSRHDTSASRNLDETFGYDELNRLEAVLKSVNGGAAQATLSLQYDAAGNITYKSDVGTYLYGQGGAGPHAVTSAGGVNYSYDANGNQTSGDGRTIAYSVFDKPTLITKSTESTEFHYGIGHQRVRRTDSNTVEGSKTTWYFGSVERIQAGSGNPYFKRYLGGSAIANYYPGTQTQDVHYLVKDHLGSIHTITDATGLAANAEGLSFDAFGQRRAVDWSAVLAGSGLAYANSKTTRGFTGHEHADGMGLIHMNGRIYDPKLGRMLQADPFVQDAKDSQSLNRYTYVNNNPLSYTDPSGYFSFSRFVKRWGRVIIAIAASIVTYGAASGWTAGWLAGTALAGNTIAIGAIAGGIAGFVGGAIISGNIQGAVKGAFSGATLGGVAGYFGNNYSLSRIAADSLAGGVSAQFYGQEFKDGALFGALVSAATFITVRLRAYQKAQSAHTPGQIGDSKGFRGIDGKVAGERIFEELWIDSGAAQALEEGKSLDWVIENIYLPHRRSLSPLGGFQGGERLIFGQSYRSGGLIDYVLEGYSGVHDSLNQPFFYTANGTNQTLSGFWQKRLGYLINPANVLLASPVVLPALVPDYLRYVYFQAQDI